jgi:5-enolpyruvylshikimate-3-phosphate synthase
MNPKIFPALLIALDLCASVAYLCHGDYRRAVYWLAAAVLTTSVTV